MKLTKKHFEQFKKYCLEYQKQFELSGWDIYYEFKNLDGVYARTQLDLEAMNATIQFNKVWDEGGAIRICNPREMKLVAKHELLHILIGKLNALAQYRYLQHRELESAEHDIIRKLEILIPN